MRAKSKQGRKERKSSLNTQYWKHEENLSVHPGGQASPPACCCASTADTLYSANLPHGIYSCL